MERCTISDCPCRGNGAISKSKAPMFHSCSKGGNSKRHRYDLLQKCSACMNPHNWEAGSEQIRNDRAAVLKAGSVALPFKRFYQNVSARLRLVTDVSMPGGRWVSLPDSVGSASFQDNQVCLRLASDVDYNLHRGHHLVDVQPSDNVVTLSIQYSSASDFLVYNSKVVDCIALKLCSATDAVDVGRLISALLSPLSTATAHSEGAWMIRFPPSEILPVLFDPSLEPLILQAMVVLSDETSQSQKTIDYLRSEEFVQLQQYILDIGDKFNNLF